MYRYMCDGTMGMGLFDSPVDLLTVHLMIEHRGQRWGGGCSRARQARANSVPSSLARACRGTGPLLPLRGARALGLEESHVYELKCVVLFVRSVLGCSVTTRAVHATLAANSQHLGATEGERCRSTHSTSTCTESPGRRSSCVRPCSTLSRIRPRASSRSSTFCTSIWWAIRMPSGGARWVWRPRWRTCSRRGASLTTSICAAALRRGVDGELHSPGAQVAAISRGDRGRAAICRAARSSDEPYEPDEPDDRDAANAVRPAYAQRPALDLALKQPCRSADGRVVC